MVSSTRDRVDGTLAAEILRLLRGVVPAAGLRSLGGE